MTQRNLYKGFQRLFETVKSKFWYSTTEMIFVLIFVNCFQAVFGPENSIVGVIFVILMPSSLMKDMTAAPMRHFLVQTAALLSMATAACLVGILHPAAAFGINFLAAFLILYAYTYEYANNLYFPYILSYLFMIFISPVSLVQLPKRLIGVLVGCVGIILYQYIRGRNRTAQDASGALLTILDETCQYIDYPLYGKEIKDSEETVRQNLCKLSKLVYNRRKSPLRVSDASFAMIDCGRGLEHLILLLHGLKPDGTPEQEAALKKVKEQITAFRAFVEKGNASLPALQEKDFNGNGKQKEGEIYHALLYIQEHLLKMTDPEKRNVYRKSVLSLEIRLKGALDISLVRVAYAFRTALLIAACTFLVQCMELPHGKWLLFTVASVSLPYADDVANKAKQRFLATALGVFASGVLFLLIPSSTGRTIIMVASGYVSFYFSKYVQTFACSTIGAIGGAVFMNAFSFSEISSVLVIRLGYICVGIAIAYGVNCLILPFKRSLATRHLWKRYEKTVRLLTKICNKNTVDTQLYYNLIIQSHMIEEKLTQNAAAEGWDDMRDMLDKCRDAVRNAHHKHRAEILPS